MATLRRRSTLGSNSNLDVSIDHNDDGLSPVSSYTPRRFAKIERSPAMDKLLFIVGVVLLVLPWVFHSNQDYQMRLLESDIEALQQERRRLKDQVKTYSTTIAGVRQQADVVERQSSLMLEQIHSSGDTIDLGLDKYHDAETVEDAMFGRLDDMEQALQHRAKRNLREQYGDGPYQVKVTVTDGQWFVVETAPREAMPHAIELFLRLVELHAYDGLSLSRSKSSSILHTAEISARKQVYLQEHFAQFNIPTKMAFAERSEDYVMEKYSVVFSGRPGGPHFYINLEDQSTRDEVDDREPCFGKIVQGQHVLVSMTQARSSTLYGIQSMRVLTTKVEK